jgi:hypothetical protein
MIMEQDFCFNFFKKIPSRIIYECMRQLDWHKQQSVMMNAILAFPFGGGRLAASVVAASLPPPPPRAVE